MALFTSIGGFKAAFPKLQQMGLSQLNLFKWIQTLCNLNSPRHYGPCEFVINWYLIRIIKFIASLPYLYIY